MSFITQSSGVRAPVDSYFQTNLRIMADQLLFHCVPTNSKEQQTEENRGLERQYKRKVKKNLNYIHLQNKVDSRK